MGSSICQEQLSIFNKSAASHLASLASTASLIQIGHAALSLQSRFDTHLTSCISSLSQSSLNIGQTLSLHVAFTSSTAAFSTALQELVDARKFITELISAGRNLDFPSFDAVNEQTSLEIEQAAAIIIQSAESELTLQGAVDKIVAAIEQQRKPTVSNFLWMLFMMVVGAVIQTSISNFINIHIPSVLEEAKSPQSATKAIKASAIQAVGEAELLADFRFVSNKILIVRQHPRTKSPELGRLEFGMVVQLVRKEKDFALVVWRDKALDVEIQGWVFARHLRKFQ